MAGSSNYCPDCGSSESVFSKYRDGGSVLRCNACGNEWPNPNYMGTGKPKNAPKAEVTPLTVKTYRNAHQALAVLLAMEDGETVKDGIPAKYANKATKTLWPHISENLQGKLVMR